jgi:hypothetical protein
MKNNAGIFMQIGDMIIIEEDGYKNNHLHVRVRCQICGFERIVSKHNLQSAGSKHNISTCGKSYIEHEYVGRYYGDYKVVGVGDKNKIKLECVVCEKTQEVYECNLKERFHNSSTCGELYYNSLIGFNIGDFKVIGYKKTNNVYYVNIKCNICNRERSVNGYSLFIHIFSMNGL